MKPITGERMKPNPGWAIIEPEEKTQVGSMYLPDSAKGEMQQGTIVAINPEWQKDGQSFDYSLINHVGDKVVFRKYYDNDLEVDEKKYKVVHIDNIMLVL